MSKHTPGPWDFSEQKGSPGHCFVAQVWDSEGESLAVLDSTIDPEIATANARMMAAAPDLLEALKGVLDSYEAYLAINESKPESHWNEYDHMMIPKWRAAQAAIKKATGEQ